MTRIERIVAFVRERGEATSREIAAHLGQDWRRCSSVVSQARHYGHLRVVRKQRTAASHRHYDLVYAVAPLRPVVRLKNSPVRP